MIHYVQLTRAFLCMLAFLSFCIPANAQIFLEDGKIEHDVTPGENIAGKLTLHNTSDRSESVKVYWEDFDYKPPFDGSKEFLPRGTSDTSISDWVNVSFRTLTLGPHSSKTISYTINVPEELRYGHQGVLFFESAAIEAKGEKGLSIISRIGCLFFIEPKNKSIKAGIENFRFGDKELTGDFTNHGNVILIPDGTFYVINQEGFVFDRGQIKKIYLPPDKTADYSLTFNRDLDPGAYTLVMTVAMKDDNVLVKEIDFEKNYPSGFKIIEIRD